MNGVSASVANVNAAIAHPEIDDTTPEGAQHSGGGGPTLPEAGRMTDPRRKRNIRTGLFFGAIAVAFYLVVIIKYKVFGS